MAFAQLKVAFTPRFSDGVYGDFLTIGNNMLSTTATGNYTGASGNHDLTTVFVDIDADATTFNSSSADLNGPIAGTNCVAIKKAYLYWAAADFEEENSGDEPNWNYNDIKLMLPGAATYTTITADNVIYRGRTEHFYNDPYACFKDITAQVQALASPFGKYQVANVRTKKGTLNPGHASSNIGTSGGWQIIFIYEGTELDQQGNSVLPQKYISVFDGYANVSSTQNDYDITISGFTTPPAGPVQTKIMFGSLEGDRDLTGDHFKIKNVSNTFIDLTTGSNRPTNNFFNSRITVENSDFLSRNPASTNTLGYDIGYFTLNNPSNSVIGNNQTSAVFRLTSDQEVYGLYMLGFSTDVWAPDLSPLVQTSSPATVNPGDVISYSFVVKNNGNDNAQNVVITRTIPQEVDLVEPITPLPTGVTYTYNTVTRVLSFFVANNLVEVGDAPITISYKTKVKDQCYFLETACVPNTSAQLLATYKGAINPNTQTTLSSNGTTGCGLGNDKPNTTNINTPSAATWSTLPGALNRTVNCNDAQALASAQALAPVPSKCNFTLNKVSGPFVPSTNACPIKGTYTNTWTFTDKCGRTSPVYTQIITVQDTTKPVITGTPADITYACASDVPTASNTSVSASDNCAGTVTVSVSDAISGQSCANKYTITRTWTATDVCGNSTTSQQIIRVNDSIKPVITGTPANITYACASSVPAASNTSVSASDNCAGTVTVSVSDAISGQSCANKYTITRTWTATDVCGNSTTSQQIIRVNDSIKPVITGTPANITYACASSVPAA
ncbi:MAG TPA: hypothetical protein PKK35_12530, partial [Chitinophagales bacterium]|nr:hypothetical protein [Chitinophagales bacterium]